jgi:prepilin-type N-terminal cleavage/methylation domain-containing protein
MILREDGFTLIELLVAIVVMAVGVLSLVGVLEASGRLTQVSERQSSLITVHSSSSSGSRRCRTPRSR